MEDKKNNKLIIKILRHDKKRGRIKCDINGTYYDLPKGLIKKLVMTKRLKNIELMSEIKIHKSLEIYSSSLKIPYTCPMCSSTVFYNSNFCFYCGIKLNWI